MATPFESKLVDGMPWAQLGTEGICRREEIGWDERYEYGTSSLDVYTRLKDPMKDLPPRLRS